MMKEVKERAMKKTMPKNDAKGKTMANKMPKNDAPGKKKKKKSGDRPMCGK